MKLEKAMSGLWGFLLSFTIGFAAVSCLATAMYMAVDLKVLAGVCFVAAVFFSACYSLPLGAVPPAAVGIVGGALLFRGDLLQGLESLLYRVSRQYDRGYGWGVIRWSVRSADEMEATLELGMCALAVVIVLLVAWTVCRKKPTVVALIPSTVPLALCLVVTDTVPDLVWLFLFLAAALLLLLSQTVRRQDPEQGNRLCTVLVLPITIVLLILFAAIPKDGYTGQKQAQAMVDAVLENPVMDRLFGRFFEKGITGSSVDAGIVRLDSVGIRVASRAEILRMSANFDGVVYLRGRALDAYDGKTWKESGTDVKELYWPNEALMENRGEVVITTRYAHRMLYLPNYTRSSLLLDVSRSLENENKLTMYSFACADVSMAAYTALYPAMTDKPYWRINQDKYIHLTDEVKAWAEPLAQRIIGDIQNPYYQARAIADYVQNSATYDLRTRRMPSASKDFAQWFLETSETGYCVHYATAATVLLQAAGIPARYVTGYVAESENGHITVVRSSDAHAWVEYWLPYFGWAVLEVTPPLVALQTEGTDPIETTQPTETTVSTQPDATQDPDTTEPDRPQTEKPTTPDSAGKKEPFKIPEEVWKWLGILAIVTGVVGAVIGQRCLRLYLRRRRQARCGENDRTIAYWQELSRLYRALGQSPEEALVELVEKAKYSQHTITAEELTRLENGILIAREKLRQRSIFHQFWYRLVLVLY